ncbi:FAD-dependent monooxygenase [Amycolatopsis sp. NPDC026612]|uniref:FAD-dependent monooxygenase n=1 Tax=Amycolatopsis sp. NPDC026612 TaxID=3155466 RepID=UPI0033D55E64
MDELTAEVVVAGAGPTGLMLANELALAGVDVLVLERMHERTGLSKALNLQPRTAEMLDLRGLLGRAQDRSFATVADGHFAVIPVSYAGWDTRYPYQLGIPQAEVEAVLEERLAEQGVHVHRGHELRGFSQDAEGVTVTASGLRVRAAYLVGCDGGRSVVRKALNMSFEGIEGQGHGVSADVLLKAAPPGAPSEWRSMGAMVTSQSPGKFIGVIPLKEKNLYRLTFGDRLNRPDNLRAKVADEEVRTAVAERFGPEAEVAEIRWSSRFSDDSRLAASYRVNRVFLAGDAAHTHFPAGGQGLNLGIQDAMNLGWKLAAHLHNQAPTRLLDTYEAERHPVAKSVLNNIAAQNALIPTTPNQLALRALFRELTELPEVQKHLSGLISGLNIKYPTPPPPPPTPTHPAEGARLPDFPLPTTNYASTLFHKGKFVLLTKTPTPTPHSEVVVAEVPTLPWPNTTKVLVRPDGYVANTTGSVEGWLT